MKRNTKQCTKCKTLISLSNYNRHFNSCNKKQKLQNKVNCQFCKKYIKNKGALANHEKYYCEKNPDKKFIDNFAEYRSKVKSGELKPSNQYIKAKELGLPKPKISDETIEKIREASIKNSHIFKTEEYRKRKSEIMRQVVKDNPESYSSSNVCGRVKKYKFDGRWLTGTWELEVAKSLKKHGINWINEIEGIEYEWNGNTHLYFPDFYLTDYNMYVEVKGYEREKDRCKWKAVDNLIVIKVNEIKKIKKGIYKWTCIPSVS